MLAACFLAIALAAPADTLPRGAVRGVVQSEQSGLPVSAALVEVSDSGGHYRSLSDSLGLYRLAGLPAGTHRVRVRHLEHEPLEVEVTVPHGAEVVMDVALRFRPVLIDTVHATSPNGRTGSDTVPAQRQELARAETAGVEGNPAGGNIMPLPGDPPDNGDEFQVRGSAADLRLVLLDGAPVYAPFHMGGLLEAFEPTVLSAARLHLAGAPARFDGGLSYVMELATRAGTTDHATRGSLDMVSVRAVAEGPIAGSASYLAAGRSVHGAMLERLEGDPFPYQFRDGLLRVDIPLGQGGRLHGMAFGNHEAVRLDPDADEAGFARWRNAAGSLRYNGFVLGLPAEATVAVSDFHAWIPQTRTGPLEGITQRVRMIMEISRSTGPFRLRYGGSYDDVRIYNAIRVPALGGSRLVDADLRGSAAAGFGDAVWQASPRLLLRGGARVDVFSRRVAITLSPRFAATWLVGDQAALTLAAGRYHQYLRARDPSATPGNTLVENAQYALNGKLEVAGASHLSVALDQQLSEVRLGVEGFYKRFSGIPEARGVATHTSGFDVWARRGHGPVSGWVGYTLSWTWAGEDSSEVEFFGRHVLSAGASGQLGRRGRFSMRLQFGGPLPGGDSPLDPQPNAPAIGGVPLTGEDEGGDLEVDAPVLGSTAGQEYVRLDAQLSRTWQPRVAGRRTELTPYLRVINALDRRDPLFYRYNGGGSSPEAVATLPLLPVLGFDWRF